jgi:hypothetical protein
MRKIGQRENRNPEALRDGKSDRKMDRCGRSFIDEAVAQIVLS